MGLSFYKMSGSGNDFIVVDGRGEGVQLIDPGTVRKLCARGTGVGADGVVIIAHDSASDFRMIYFNRDGSRAEMCGNAALCVTRLAPDLGAAPPTGMRFATDSGIISARVGSDRRPEIDLAPVTVVRRDADLAREPGELRIGYAEAGVPHLVVLCADVENVDVLGRGTLLRHHPSLPRGANVNFVSRSGAEWMIRTYERGVEGETLACGTGAAASAILLREWGESGAQTTLATRSGERLTVRLQQLEEGGWSPTLAGEGRLVFRGQLEEI